MSEEYVPEVGDLVVHPSWNKIDTTKRILITAVGNEKFLGSTSDDIEHTYVLDGKWIKVGPPPSLPQRWINVYEGGVGQSCKSRSEADVFSDKQRIAVIHIDTDEFGSDIVEVERI